MSRLFGVPIDSLALMLVGGLAAALTALAVLAARNRVFLRLGVRNLRRRRARAVLIVAGLMLGTAIMTAALATGDTMSRTIRTLAISALGRTDEVVAAKGIGAAFATQSVATGTRYFPLGYADRVARAAAGSGLVAAVEPAIVEPVAVQDVTSRQNEPRVTLFASEPARMRGFGEIRAGDTTVSLADLRPGEIFLNAKGAEKLDAKPGDVLRIFAGRGSTTARVRAVVHYRGAAAVDSGVMMQLGAAQKLLGKPGQIGAVFVANRGGVARSAAVTALLEPTVSPLGLEVDQTKHDLLRTADAAGASFMSLFTTFGSFSIAAGILLIFLIFVMLAAERRGELGIARAVGTRRGHLVQMFLFEGVAYDLAAAVVGALAGVLVAYGMVLAMAHAFAATSTIHISYSVSAASIAVGYSLGVLLTLVVVAFSAWRVSRMNIVSAIRNLGDPPVEKARRRRWLVGLGGIVVGAVLAAGGVHAKDGIVLGLGVALLLLSLVPLLRTAGAPERAVHTGAGLALILWFVLPISRWLFGDLKVNFSIFVLGGLMIVIGATWTIMYNADVLLGLVGATAGGLKSVAPILRLAMAYPLRSLFRTGVTLAMFTLVVFTLVVGAITTGSFVHAFNDVKAFGGGFDVRATSSPSAPIVDMRGAFGHAPGLRSADFRLVSSISTLPVEARQVGLGRKAESYLLHGADDVFLANTTYRLAGHARGYESTAAVWRALRLHRNLAVIDQYAVPRKANWGVPTQKFMLRGLYLEDRTFAPVKVTVRDQQTGRRTTLTVIGVLSDATPQLMAGIWTSQETLAPVFGKRVLPTTYLFALRRGVDPKTTAKKLESAFLANGMQADSVRKLLADAVSASLTFDRLIMGFMGLGLIVGVAALGVITARAVVERRQQIGVLRAIGFRRRMVQASFLLESSFIALTSIVVGTALGLIVGYNVISDARRSPSWSHLALTVPWLTLAMIFIAVYAVALATTFAPARRASRVYPAEALRYQ
ncbi:MAG TPA: FtsX-like permease family protein [Gaiellaceae bacterium]|nr:FtsX-like permease family protein [Gaiellaceae bacterium]